MGGENRRDAARGDDGPHFSPQRSDPPVQGVGRDRARVACAEKFPAAAAGASLDGAADPGACVSLRPGAADRTVDEEISPVGVGTKGCGRAAADQGGHGDLSGGKFPGDDGRHGGAEGSAQAIGRPPVVRGPSGIV